MKPTGSVKNYSAYVSMNVNYYHCHKNNKFQTDKLFKYFKFILNADDRIREKTLQGKVSLMGQWCVPKPGN